MKLTTCLLCLSFIFTTSALATDVAVCGASDGQGYYPNAGLRAAEQSVWTSDRISEGRITLSLTAQNAFDILITDATGSVFSAAGDGAKVVRVGQTDSSITVLVVYPMVVETYTFLITGSGPEVMWTANKHATPMPKVGAYRAPCTFIELPK